eukprot:829161_1
MFASRFRWYQPARHVQRARHTPFVRVLSLKTRPVKTDTDNKNDILESQTKLRSLAFRHPKVAAEFHPTKNGDLSPTKIRYSSKKSVWWQCGREKHEWQASLNSRTNMGCGCPFCSGYHSSRTGDKGCGCPFCSGLRVTSKNSLAVQKPKVAVTDKNSLIIQNPKIAAEFSSIQERRSFSDRLACQFQQGSGKKVWWRCATDPEHEWQARTSSRTGDKGSGCPFCSLRVTDENSLIIQKPKIAAEFHPSKNGDLSLTDFPDMSAPTRRCGGAVPLTRNTNGKLVQVVVPVTRGAAVRFVAVFELRTKIR